MNQITFETLVVRMFARKCNCKQVLMISCGITDCFGICNRPRTGKVAVITPFVGSSWSEDRLPVVLEFSSLCDLLSTFTDKNSQIKEWQEQS